MGMLPAKVTVLKLYPQDVLGYEINYRYRVRPSSAYQSHLREERRFAAQPLRYSILGKMGYWWGLLTSAMWPVLYIWKLIAKHLGCKWDWNGMDELCYVASAQHNGVQHSGFGGGKG